MPPVISHRDSGAGIITMAEGEKGNRLNPGLLSALEDALKIHLSDESVRFILLRSNAPAFSLGMDLEAFISGNPRLAASEFRQSITAYSQLLQHIHEAPKTVVGVIEGSVKAGGVGLAAACDIVIASETADFELSELYLGLIPANLMPYVLCARLPMKRAAYLVQSAACVDARTALNWGLADEVHPAEALEKALKKLGRRLMRISPNALARQKVFARKMESSAPEERGILAINELVDIASAPEVFDAVKRFIDGDLPPWFETFRPNGPLCGSREGIMK